MLERNTALGAETSSRNSEVIHAGLYYPPGSLRAKLCVKGKELLYEFATQHGIDHRRCGKLVVATTAEECTRLDALLEHAQKNGVTDATIICAEDAQAMEPALGCKGALYSPSTGIIDSHALIVAIETDITANGGTIALNTHVVGLRHTTDQTFEVKTNEQSGPYQITAKKLILAGGLSATALGSMLDYPSRYEVPTTFPARGHYYTLNTRAPFNRLIYPVPGTGSLGIHLTIDCGGQAKFGPDLEWITTPDMSSLDQYYAFDDLDETRLKKFEHAIRRYWPGLPNNALWPGYIGIRPKLYAEDQPPRDFEIHTKENHGIKNLVALYGIESPGLTSSLAVGEFVAEQLR